MKAPIAFGRVLIVLFSLAAAACSADESDHGQSFSLSLNATDKATPADVGLPAYPGSTVHDDDGDGTHSANIGFSIPSFGLKVVATEMRSDDQPQRVAAFYRKALAKYGDVLDCSAGSQDSRKSRRRDDAKGDLTCDGDAAADSILYKAGTDENQRIVSIKPHGRGARFSLVHVAVRGRSN
jgi:hypothetical protein